MCVLLVDDEPLILMVLEDTLPDAEFGVMTSIDATEAIKLLRDYPATSPPWSQTSTCRAS